MKYKITKTDLLINSKLHSEGSEVELTKDQAAGIEEYLIPLKAGHSTLAAESASKSHPELVEGSKTNSNKKTKTKSSVALAKDGKRGKK
jgi:hypothetical protein